MIETKGRELQNEVSPSSSLQISLAGDLSRTFRKMFVLQFLGPGPSRDVFFLPTKKIAKNKKKSRTFQATKIDSQEMVLVLVTGGRDARDYI